MGLWDVVKCCFMRNFKKYMYIFNIINSQNVMGHLKSDSEAATMVENSS